MSSARKLDQRGCPACTSITFTDLESIDLVKQHRYYAPADEVMQAELTAAAREYVGAYSMRRCGACGLHYAHPLVSPGARWYGMAYRAMTLYPTERWEFRRVASQFTATDVVAEFGCGSGNFLRLCAASGVACVGYDFAANAVQECRRGGLRAELLDVAAEPVDGSSQLSFNILAAFHVLEHLEDPSWLFRSAAIVASESARLFVSVPSDRRASRLYGEEDLMDQPPHHLTRWTPRALDEIGKDAGWRLESFEYEPVSVRSELWARTVRMSAYRKLARSARAGANSTERAARLLLYPAALWQRLTEEPSMTGFSMLARYRRKQGVTRPSAAAFLARVGQDD